MGVREGEVLDCLKLNFKKKKKKKGHHKTTTTKPLNLILQRKVVLVRSLLHFSVREQV